MRFYTIYQQTLVKSLIATNIIWLFKSVKQWNNLTVICRTLIYTHVWRDTAGEMPDDFEHTKLCGLAS